MKGMILEKLLEVIKWGLIIVIALTAYNLMQLELKVDATVTHEHGLTYGQ